jgi:hypothetical protein
LKGLRLAGWDETGTALTDSLNEFTLDNCALLLVADVAAMVVGVVEVEVEVRLQEVKPIWEKQSMNTSKVFLAIMYQCIIV